MKCPLLALAKKIFESNRLLLLLLLASTASGQNSSQTGTLEFIISQRDPYYVAEQGPNHKLWQSVTWFTNSVNGSIKTMTNSYTELATGMSYFKDNQWIDASDTIEPTQTGAVASNSQHQVVFLGNLNSPGAVTTITPDGKSLSTSILGLAFSDESTGKSVLIAETRDSYGQILSSGNEALYPDAFTDISADVLYVNSVHGLEQLVVLHSQIPDPAQWGLNPDTTLLQVITEFVGNVPTPQITRSPWDTEQDDHLDFGIMQMPRGAAFVIGSDSKRIPVTKHWLITGDGRTCLVEQIRLVNAAAELQNLPSPAPGTASARDLSASPVHRIANHPRIPPPRLSQKNTRSFKFALSSVHPKGFAIDYQLLTSQTNFEFKGGMTYLVSSTVSLSGTNNIVDGLCVIKFTNSPAATIAASGLIWKNGPYTPAFFTAISDDSIGEWLSGSTGNPTTNYYGGIALDLSSATNNNTVLNARFTYLSNVVAGANVTVQDSQVISCNNIFAPSSTAPTLWNDLLYLDNDVFGNTAPGTLTAVNVTAHYCTNVFLNTGGTVNLTNCLFAFVTNWQCANTFTNSDAFLSSDAGVFQTVGGGRHYLAVDSPYRNAGTAQISPVLQTDLNQRTTYPPLVYSNAVILSDTTFNPQAQRDTDVPDVGYHYAPLDYAFGFLQTSNSSAISISNGAAIGIFTTSTNKIGISLGAGVPRLFSGGSPVRRNWITTYNTVQEQLAAGWNLPESQGMISDFASSLSGALLLSFTDFSAIQGRTFNYTSYPYLIGINYSALYIGNCGFHESYINFWGSVYMTNCLFEWVGANFEPDFYNDEPPGGNGPVMLNNLFYGGTCSFYFNSVTNRHHSALIQNNLFDRPNIYSDGSPFNGGFNAFVTNYPHLNPTYSTDIFLPQSLAYQAGPIGTYYQPTNSPLLNVGSTNADQLGLYQYTVLMNQIKETNSIVDIGYHYVALDASGNPVDTNADGVPDFLSDVNGNGKVDSGEIGWNITGDLGLKLLITRPQSGSGIP